LAVLHDRESWFTEADVNCNAVSIELKCPQRRFAPLLQH